MELLDRWNLDLYTNTDNVTNRFNDHIKAMANTYDQKETTQNPVVEANALSGKIDKSQHQLNMVT
jgi:predicted transcriptional regulator